jgi:hypothetical protein
MGIDLIPAVYWITQNSDVEYGDTRLDVFRMFRRYAGSVLGRYAPPERSGRDADALIYDGLLELQRIILDQYLPPVEPERVRSVACLWPWWERTGMKVLAGGCVDKLKPLPDGNGGAHCLEGRGWTFHFYRNDSVEQRRIWVCHLIKGQAREAGRELSHDLQLDEESLPRPAPPRYDPFKDKFEILDLISITDPRDWSDARLKGSAPDERQRRHRARERFRTARRILYFALTEPVAKSHLKRLSKTEPLNRRTILDRFNPLYPRDDQDEESDE